MAWPVELYVTLVPVLHKINEGIVMVLFAYPSLSVLPSLVGCLKMFSTKADLIA